MKLFQSNQTFLYLVLERVIGYVLHPKAIIRYRSNSDRIFQVKLICFTQILYSSGFIQSFQITVAIFYKRWKMLRLRSIHPQKKYNNPFCLALTKLLNSKYFCQL